MSRDDEDEDDSDIIVPRKCPKNHKEKTIYVGTVDDIDNLSLEEIISYFKNIDTYDLLEPRYFFEAPYEYSYYINIKVSGFVKMTDKEIEKREDQARKRKAAAQKRQATIANREKAQLKKLAEKYPEVVRSDSYII